MSIVTIKDRTVRATSVSIVTIKQRRVRATTVSIITIKHKTCYEKVSRNNEVENSEWHDEAYCKNKGKEQCPL